MGQRASKERCEQELLGSFGAGQDEEEPEQHVMREDDEEEEAEEQRPRKRARRQRRRATESVEEGGAAPAAAKKGGAKRGGAAKRAPRQPRKQAQREVSEPLPPAQLLGRGDFLGALHACPTLIDMILQQDGLRTPALLARDAANLAIALCATAEQMDAAWRALAARAAGGEGFAGTTAEALAAAQAAVKADPARTQRCTTTTAKQDYRLSDKDLGGLECETQRNPIFWSAAPTRLYRVLDCLAIAHRKYGDLAGIQAAKAKAQERGQKVKATRQGNTQRRKEEIQEALEEAGLDWSKHERNPEVAAFIKHGKQSAAEVVADLKKSEQAAADQAERELKLRQRLDKEGLPYPKYDLTVQRYVSGDGKETLTSVVGKLKKENEERQAANARKETLKKRLRQEGLLGAAENLFEDDIPGAPEYIGTGKGSLDDLVAAARAAAQEEEEEEQQWQQRQQGVEQRGEEVGQLLEAAHIPFPEFWRYGSVAHSYVQYGKGTVQDAFEDVKTRHESELARQQRRERLSNLLAAEGLQLWDCQDESSIQRYLLGQADFSEEQLLAAARTHCQQAQQQRQKLQAEIERSVRESLMAQLLAGAGLHSFYAFTVPAATAFIATGQGIARDALAAAREYHRQQTGGANLGAAAAAAAGAAGAALPRTSQEPSRGMSGRRASKRERRKPELFGSYGAGQDEEQEPEQHLSSEEEEEEEVEEEQRPRKRARRQRRRAADSEEEEEEGAGPAAAAAKQGGARRGGAAKRAPRQPRKQAQHEVSEPLPPAQPLSRGDFMGALHACPTLIDMILQQDGLRTPTLLAHDAANLAIALCATAEQMDGAWRTLAARAAGGEGFAGTTAEALAAAQAAVKADPARSQRCTTTTAKQDYRLSDKDLGGLECETQRNPIFWSAAPTRLYRVLDCLAIAHRKYGDLAGIQAAKAKAQERGQKVKATRQGNTQRRKEEIEEAVKEAGLDWSKYQRSSEVAAFVKHGKQTAAEVAANLKKAEEAETKWAERERKLRKRLEKEGISYEKYSLPVQRYLGGQDNETLSSTVAALKKGQAERQEKEARREEVKARLREEGLLGADESFYEFAIRGASTYINRGEGSLDEVVEAARTNKQAQTERQQRWKQQGEEREQREAELRQLMTDGGLVAPAYWGSGAAYEFVQQGKGTAQQAFAEEKTRHEARAAKQQRQEQLRALLAAHGLQLYQCDGESRIQRHLHGNALLTDEQLVAAAQAHVQAERERNQQRQVQLDRDMRESSMKRMLTDAGLHSFYAFTVPVVATFIATGQGNYNDALAAAREYHQQQTGAGDPAAAAPAAAAAALPQA